MAGFRPKDDPHLGHFPACKHRGRRTYCMLGTPRLPAEGFAEPSVSWMGPGVRFAGRSDELRDSPSVAALRPVKYK